jgi:hypothetical protein
VSSRAGKLHRLLAVLLATFGFVLVAELAFRLFLPVSDIPYWVGDPRLGYRHQGNLSGTFASGEHRARFRLNGRGWNNPSEYRSERREGRLRVAILGDSYVEGLQVDVEEGVGPDLESLLTAEGLRAEVYTYGISGASTAYAHDLLESEVLADRPDCIVYLFINNDVADSVPFLGRGLQGGPLYDIDDRGRLLRLPPATYRPRSYRRVLSGSALFRYFWINRGLGTAWQVGRISDWLRGRVNSQEPDQDAIYRDPSPPWKRAWEVVGDLMGEMSARSEAAGAIFLVVNRPHPGNFYGPPESRNLNLPEATLRDLSHRHSFTFVDLGPFFARDWKARGERFDFETDSHWNKHGHRVAAEAIAKLLENEVRRPNRVASLQGISH